MFPLFSLWRGNFDWSKGDYAQEMFLELCKPALKYTWKGCFVRCPGVRIQSLGPKWTILPNSNKLMRLADRVGSFCTSKALVWQCFLKTLYQSEYETLKFKPLQIEAENVKTRRFEHRCLICRSCWSFLPSGMVLDFSMFDAVVWYCKTQYRRQHWLEMLYRKDVLFDRVLLFSAMRRMILRPHCHVACRVAKKTAPYCVHAGAVGNDVRCIALLGRYEK